MIDGLLLDIRAALRSYRRRRGFAVLIVVTFAVGLGSAVGVFTVADRVLLRQPPYPSPEQLVVIDRVPSVFANGRVSVQQDFRSLGLWSSLGLFQRGAVNVEVGSSSLRVSASAVDADFFKSLGAPVLLGRVFLEQSGAAPEAVLSYGLWQRVFSGDPGALARTISVNSRSFDVIGVMPASVSFPNGTDIWIPPLSDRQITGFAYIPSGLGRLLTPITMRQATGVIRAAGGAFPQLADRVQSFNTYLHTDVVAPIGVVAAIASLLLLATCGNLSGLLLLELHKRQVDIRTRLALGASGGILVRQVVVEACLLSVAGIAAGLAIAATVASFLSKVLTADSPGIGLVTTTTRGVAIFVAVSGTLLVAMSVVPAVFATRFGALGPSASGRVTVRLARQQFLLVVTQIALSTLLVSAACGGVLELRRLEQIDLGFTKDSSGIFRLAPPLSKYQDGAILGRLSENLLMGLRQSGEVRYAGVAGQAFDESEVALGLALELADRRSTDLAGRGFAARVAIDGDYLQALGVRLIAGRYPESEDRNAVPRRVILSESAARSLSRDPSSIVGRELRDGVDRLAISGVVADVQPLGPTVRSVGQLYEPLPQTEHVPATLTVAIAPTASFRVALKAAGDVLARLDHQMPLFAPVELGDARRRYLRREYATCDLAVGAALSAVLLSMVGMIGGMSLAITQRRSEIGVRLALGARPLSVYRHLMAFCLRATAAGVILGGALAWLASRALAAVLTGDPATAESIGLSSIILTAVVVSAASCLAWSAAHLDPARALARE